MTDRTVFRITGEDARDFLRGLVTNDVGRLDKGAVWAAILSPQGKYLADFFLVPEGDAILLDVATPLAAGLLQRLTMYKLRSKVSIEPSGIDVSRGLGPVPDGAFADPRHEALGWRAYDGRAGEPLDDTSIRVAHCIPESGIELIPNDTYPLEAGFERLHGVDFRKGCYVGQEVTARMKHKTELRKGLATVEIEGEAPVGTEIITEDGKAAGTLYSQAEGKAIAYLRFDRATGPMRAGDARLRLPDGA
ncbi:folate-binding protein [Alphaproteobacteria bacterium GH1-50]|uniref:Folate-binding protein n=1 Tax=Kangsaoukella pontilimi TaxID=2691042 RepID=A0A7C9MJN7_9RHOB|nr:folate-binding protein YgfZ [Kangsaoukella pontilimi]MXQ07915.1 folate-binding protein [Kangsaoukella pontilimi]